MSINHLFREPVEIIDALSDVKVINREATAKRWAKLHGYSGAQGGFIYSDTTHKPICQGWFAFFVKFRALILADVEAGTFKPSHYR